MSLHSATSMDGKPPLEQAQAAILHVLNRIHTDPAIGWYLGLGTESFALLTEAYATLSCNEDSLPTVRESFAPLRPANPALDEQARDTAIECAMQNWEPGNDELESLTDDMALPTRLEFLQRLRERYCFACGGIVPIKPCGCQRSGMRREHRTERSRS